MSGEKLPNLFGIVKLNSLAPLPRLSLPLKGKLPVSNQIPSLPPDIFTATQELFWRMNNAVHSAARCKVQGTAWRPSQWYYACEPEPMTTAIRRRAHFSNCNLCGNRSLPLSPLQRHTSSGGKGSLYCPVRIPSHSIRFKEIHFNGEKTLASASGRHTGN